MASIKDSDLSPAARARFADQLAAGIPQAKRGVTKRAKVGDGQSDGEVALLRQVKMAGLSAPQTQFRFAPDRKWRADMAWPDAMVLVEVDGGSWSAGRHVRGAGFSEDCLKLSTAAVLGYRVLRFTTTQVEDLTALRFIERILEA